MCKSYLWRSWVEYIPEWACEGHTGSYLIKKMTQLALGGSYGIVGESCGAKVPRWRQTGGTSTAPQRGVAVETKRLCLHCLPWPFLFCRLVFRWSCSTKRRSLELSATPSSAVGRTMDALLQLREQLCPLQPQPRRPLVVDQDLPKCNFKAFQHARHNTASVSEAFSCCQKATLHTSAELRNDHNYQEYWIITWSPKMFSCYSSCWKWVNVCH